MLVSEGLCNIVLVWFNPSVVQLCSVMFSEYPSVRRMDWTSGQRQRARSRYLSRDMRSHDR